MTLRTALNAQLYLDEFHLFDSGYKLFSSFTSKIEYHEVSS